MEISASHKFVFLAVPKTASTSIRSLLKPYCLKFDQRLFDDIIDNDWLHLDPDTIKNIVARINLNISDYFEFRFVRHPYDKVLSHIAYARTPQISMRKNIDLSHYMDVDKIIDMYEDNIIHKKWYGKSRYMFCEQSLWADHLTNNSHVYKYEDLNNAWIDIRNKINIDLPDLPHENKSNYKGLSLNDDQKSRIRYIFKSDFERFGYEG